MATTKQEFSRRVLEKIQEWKGNGENLFKSLADCYADVESRELALSLGRESLQKREKDLEEREREFYLFVEEKKGELVVREEDLDRQLKKVNDHIEKLEASQRENEGSWNRKCCEKMRKIENREREIDVLSESVEKRLREIEKREKEFDKFREEIVSKNGNYESINEVLRKNQKVTFKLIERLETSMELMLKTKDKIDERFEQFKSMETAALDSLTTKQKAADSVNEILENRFRELEKLEHELEAKEQQLRTTRADFRDDVKVKEEVLTEEHKLGSECSESKETNPLKLQTDREIFEMIVNRSYEDLELMEDDILKVPMLSSDPAKFVLKAVDGFYTSRLRKGSEESKLRRVSILLLDQLISMCPDIHPRVRGAALELAHKWISNMSTMAEYRSDKLVLLLLLAAYNLSSDFDKSKLCSFALSVAQHKQTPHLCRILGLTEKMPDIVQNLIREKQYLLASTYIYEYGLDNLYRQAVVLDCYVRHVKWSAGRCRRDNYSGAQEEANAGEIVDLRAAVDHIYKYELESEYPVDALVERIEQLERDPACASPPMGDLRGQSSWDANRMNVLQKRRFSPPRKAQKWQSRRDEHPSTSLVDFRISSASLSQKKRKKHYSSMGVRSSFHH